MSCRTSVFPSERGVEAVFARLRPQDAGTRWDRVGLTSPCRKRGYGLKAALRTGAGWGGDIGCRFTPEILEMLEKALELRKKGIIKF